MEIKKKLSGLWSMVYGRLKDIRLSTIDYRLSTRLFLSSLLICILSFGIYTHAYALNLDKVKVYFLDGDYKSAILEGEKILADSAYSSDLDGLYYILGLSYLKDGNFLRASDIFEIIESEFKDSPFKEEAKLGLGDVYFLRGDYNQAERYYRELLNNNSRTKLKAMVYYRLSQVGFKKGNTQEAKEYLDKLKEEFPFELETKLNQDYATLSDIYYTVQVGSFSKPTNAGNLCNRLINKGYDAYVQEIDAHDRKIYRVRVGRLKLRPDVVRLEEKLSSEGYPTKIVP
jgi:tetratricopeptide (TPR) repeat protein